MPVRPNRVEARASFLDRAEEFTPLLGVDAHGARYLFSSSDHHIGRSLFVKAGRSEMRLLDRALRVLAFVGKPASSGTFIDVGANIGTTTIPALRDHAFAKAVACEPEADNIALLTLNVVANNLEHEVTVCPAAIGDADGEVEFIVFEHRSGRHEVLPPQESSAEDAARMQRKGATVTVPLVTLDTLAAQGTFAAEEVGLLWMDAQGHEGQILRGGSTLTERGVPFVMELDPDALERHGGLEHVLEATRSQYTDFVSLRLVRQGAALTFPLQGVAELEEELAWLSENNAFTDVLFLRDPEVRPEAAQSVHREAGTEPKAKSEEEEAPQTAPEPEPKTPEERSEFLVEARRFTPIVAADLNGTRYLVQVRDPETSPLFVTHDYPGLALLEQAMAQLDELGLGEQARARAFLHVGARTGLETVAALRDHGFASAVAIEGNARDYSLLKLNVSVNDLGARTRTVPAMLSADPEEGESSLDGLFERGILSAADVGLVWIDDRRAGHGALRGGRTILRAGAPLVLRLHKADSGLARRAQGRLSERYDSISLGEGHDLLWVPRPEPVPENLD